MSATIRAMTAPDLTQVIALVKKTEGLAFQNWEDKPVLERALERNEKLSQVAVDEHGKIIGAVFIGEGIMAMVHHLTVDPQARNPRYGSTDAPVALKNLGTKLVQTGLRQLYQTPNASRRVYVTVLKENKVAQAFWTKFGCSLQAEGNLVTFTLNLEDQAWLRA